MFAPRRGVSLWHPSNTGSAALKSAGPRQALAHDPDVPLTPLAADLLEALPRKRIVAAEFRNRGWFTEETYKLLRDHGVAFASTNRAGAPEVDTAGFAYLRWEGDRKTVVAERGEVQVDRAAETAAWASKVKRHLADGRDAYGYFSKYYSGYPPHDAETLREAL